MYLKGIENIVSRILGDAEISAGEIAAAADAQVAKILQEADEAAKQLYSQGMKRADREVENVMLRTKSNTDLEGRKTLLAARQSVVDEAFAKAEEKLESLRKDKAAYTKLLVDMAGPVLQDNSVVLLSKEDFAAVGQTLKEGLGKASVEAADIPSGGLVVTSGGIELNLTFSALLRQYREELEQAVASVLFQ